MKKAASKLILTSFILFTALGFTHHSAYAEADHSIFVTLETIYEDGDKKVETRTENVQSMEDFWAKYTAWQLVNMSKEEVVFRSQVPELSPLTIFSGYSSVSP
ncbi:BofC N-terminal domain-containing protein [Jeotgalibacillus campisalis]|uniref:Bypass-of-forespore C N-terminal domain-containing protein n=1 Tax=Jeotgalibacillus campisalis TaxID=220754 RepID=A0A0C2R7A4_9BACL|nr:BofC N-terminal domain-containing protein [Jeotgalibacillus campisalis]KIL46120.1 hypothetical protein KR50_27950 [Jeotgalibacillus campisalis]